MSSVHRTEVHKTGEEVGVHLHGVNGGRYYYEMSEKEALNLGHDLIAQVVNNQRARQAAERKVKVVARRSVGV